MRYIAHEVKLFFNTNKMNEKCILVNFRAAFLTAAVIYCLAAGARWHVIRKVDVYDDDMHIVHILNSNLKCYIEQY